MKRFELEKGKEVLEPDDLKRLGVRYVKVKDPDTGKMKPEEEMYLKTPITDFNEVLEKIQKSEHPEEVRDIMDRYFLSKPKSESKWSRVLFVGHRRIEILYNQGRDRYRPRLLMECRINDLLVRIYRPGILDDSLKVWTKKEAAPDDAPFEYQGAISVQDMVLLGIEDAMSLLVKD